ncbi:MAG: sigma-54 dependent transcriptional regulator [Desulfoplanes sp.]|nr:sigma-54 dependent transcriptional regulator [Desulfoplanes sp.]MDD4649261.1 sigma-54 dependent transcriptional regulator [Desulfoplanes sp.]
MGKILVIGKQCEFCESILSLSQRMGHEAVFAQGGREGYAVASSDASYEVVFLDIMLDSGQGLEWIVKLQELSSMPDIIAMAENGDPETAASAISQGAWDYLGTPVSIGAVQCMISRVLQSRQKRKEFSAQKILKRDKILGRSVKLRRCLDALARASESMCSILFVGETGTGKELFASALHDNSLRADKRLVVVDCTNLTRTLAESLLFGHDKGAFTGAVAKKQGLIAQADTSSLFLDEIGELPVTVQKSFLRVLQEKRYRPLGSKYEEQSDFRLISATNRSLLSMVEKEEFRKDLYFRISGMVIDLPSLRERKEDIQDFVDHYVPQICEEYQVMDKSPSEDFMQALHCYDWPGNVRELINTLYIAVNNAMDEAHLYPHHLPVDVRVKIIQSNFYDHAKPEIHPLVQSRPPKIPVATIDPRTFPTYKEKREEAVSNMEEVYLSDLELISQGDIIAACKFSGLSRARLYQLLKKQGLYFRKHGKNKAS